MPTFETPLPIFVVIELAVGDVNLVATERSDTAVSVVAADPSNNLSIQAAHAVNTDFAEGRLTIGQSMPWYQSYGADVPGPLVTITVELPTGSTVRGQTGLGTYSSQGHLGECSVNMANGDVRLDSVGATLRIKGSNGDITVRRVIGDVDVDVKTSNGSIVIGEVTTGVVKLVTSTGRIEVGVRPGTAANLDVRTKLGLVRNMLTTIDTPEGYRSTVKIRARTNLQDIVIRPAVEAAQA